MIHEQRQVLTHRYDVRRHADVAPPLADVHRAVPIDHERRRTRAQWRHQMTFTEIPTVRRLEEKATVERGDETACRTLGDRRRVLPEQSSRTEAARVQTSTQELRVHPGDARHNQCRSGELNRCGVDRWHTVDEPASRTEHTLTGQSRTRV